jgi:hypothetical protein
MTSWMAARDPDRGREAADALGGRFLELDVRDDSNVARLSDYRGRLPGLRHFRDGTRFHPG